MKRKSGQIDYIAYDSASRQTWLTKKKDKKPFKKKSVKKVKKTQFPPDLVKTFDYLESFSEKTVASKELISESENSKIIIKCHD
jgi:hypothetical protein